MKIEQPKILIAKEVYDKVLYWVNKSPVEISGLGKCVFKDGNYIVTSAHLLEQENGPASTDIDAEAASKLQYETREEEGHLNWWWHSHVNMNVFWSGTDTATIKEFGGNGMVVATVFNKRDQSRSAFYQGGDSFYPEVFMDDLKTGIYYPATAQDTAAWDAEYDKKCKQAKPLWQNGNTIQENTWRFFANDGVWKVFKKGKGWVDKGKELPVGKSKTSQKQSKTSGKTTTDGNHTINFIANEVADILCDKTLL